MPMPVPGMYAFGDPFGTGGVVWPSRGRLVKFLPSMFQISGTAIGVFL